MLNESQKTRYDEVYNMSQKKVTAEGGHVSRHGARIESLRSETEAVQRILDKDTADLNAGERARGYLRVVELMGSQRETVPADKLLEFDSAIDFLLSLAAFDSEASEDPEDQ